MTIEVEGWMVRAAVVIGVLFVFCALAVAAAVIAVDNDREEAGW